MIDLTGVVILAGGQSSRMGTPKALLTLPNGETLLDFHIRHAKMLNVPVMVADNAKGFCPPNSASVIQDYLPNDETGKGAGALSAIAGAMDNLSSQNGYLLVISCDSLLGADTVFDQLNILQDADVLYLKGGRDYPLLGLYRTNLIKKLKAYLDNDNHSVMKFLRDKKVKTVVLPNEWVNLANFNTNEEFESALKESKSGTK